MSAIEWPAEPRDGSWLASVGHLDVEVQPDGTVVDRSWHEHDPAEVPPSSLTITYEDGSSYHYGADTATRRD